MTLMLYLAASWIALCFAGLALALLIATIANRRSERAQRIESWVSAPDAAGLILLDELDQERLANIIPFPASRHGGAA